MQTDNPNADSNFGARSFVRKASLRKISFKWHKLLAWVGAFALLGFVLSAITHPLLVWTGPQSTAFRPPQAIIDTQHVKQIETVLTQHQINRAVVVKLVPSKDKVLLQVTEDAKQPRRYFDLQSGAELPDYDQQHAIWLARYYALGGDTSVAVRSVTFQTEFDHAYPWVNRLLPVYKVSFENEQNLNAYVYTEINALGSLGNDYKTRLQGLFRTLHTWSWLDGFEYARVIIMAGLLLSLFAMAVTGLTLVLTLKRRKNMASTNRWHRSIANIVCVPILAFCISGFWHLLHNMQTGNDAQYNSQRTGLQLSAPINLTANVVGLNKIKDLPAASLNQLSLISHQGELFYRLSLPVKPQKRVGENKISPTDNANSEHAHHDMPTRKARFDGLKSERGGQYYSVENGERAELTDKDVALALALKHTSLDASALNSARLVTRFGPNYDFRNKRLPVWQFDFNSDSGDTVFVDPATGAIVDSITNNDRYEGYSFSFLHKWNFLTPFIGRQWRDAIIVLILLLIITMTGLGITMRYKR